MKVYRSKISQGIFLPIFFVLAVIIIVMAIEEIWAGIIPVILITAFILHTFLSTKYVIENNTLIVRCGFLINEKINIDSITTIKETSNPISSPALSLDRLEVSYNKRGRIIISPKEKSAFVAHLSAINPAIAFIQRK